MEGLPPKIWEGKKIVQNFSRFLTTFDFDREYLVIRLLSRKGVIKSVFSVQKRIHRLKIGKVVDQLQPLPRWMKKKTVNFGPQTKKLLTCILTHPSGHYSGDYISALMGCYTLKFLHALESVQGYLAHTPTGTGSPRKNLIVKI